MLNKELKVLDTDTYYRLIVSNGRKGSVEPESVPGNTAGRSVVEFHMGGSLKK